MTAPTPTPEPHCPACGSNAFTELIRTIGPDELNAPDEGPVSLDYWGCHSCGKRFYT